MMDPGSGLSLNLKKDSCCWHIFNLHSINKPPLVLHCTAIAFGHIIGVGHDRHKGSCSDLPYPIATQALCVLTATPCLQGQALLFHSSQQCKSFSIECLLVLMVQQPTPASDGTADLFFSQISETARSALLPMAGRIIQSNRARWCQFTQKLAIFSFTRFHIWQFADVHIA